MRVFFDYFERGTVLVAWVSVHDNLEFPRCQLTIRICATYLKQKFLAGLFWLPALQQPHLSNLTPFHNPGIAPFNRTRGAVIRTQQTSQVHILLVKVTDSLPMGANVVIPNPCPCEGRPGKFSVPSTH